MVIGGPIFRLLESLGVVQHDRLELFANQTRDRDAIEVWKDMESEVIFLEPGGTDVDEIYREGGFWGDELEQHDVMSEERRSDLARRLSYFSEALTGKSVVDFGCGHGDFLRALPPDASSAVGIELNHSHRDALQERGIQCFESLEQIATESVDILVSFHCLEHLSNPIFILNEISRVLRKSGYAFFEVPHAGDLLLRDRLCPSFKTFSLWSQHLILHTKESLQKMFESLGFNVVIIEGVQRYSLSNHLNWLAFGQPGGHSSTLWEFVKKPSIQREYEKALSEANLTDTLIVKVDLNSS